MSMSDNIADMVTRIRNAQSGRLLQVSDLPASKLKSAVLDVLKKEGYISGYKLDPVSRLIEIDLKYSKFGEPAIHQIHRVSKPGRRIYSPIAELSGYYNGMGINILSTSRGVMSDRDARKMNVGGEIICKVF